MGEIFTSLTKMRRLPPQHSFTATSEERSLPNGSSFYLPIVSLDVTNTHEMDGESQETLASFFGWITNYNEYIMNAWDENSSKHEKVDEDLVDDFVDVDLEDFA